VAPKHKGPELLRAVRVSLSEAGKAEYTILHPGIDATVFVRFKNDPSALHVLGALQEQDFVERYVHEYCSRQELSYMARGFPTTLVVPQLL
jgi:hypothetical protein